MNAESKKRLVSAFDAVMVANGYVWMKSPLRRTVYGKRVAENKQVLFVIQWSNTQNSFTIECGWLCDGALGSITSHFDAKAAAKLPSCILGLNIVLGKPLEWLQVRTAYTTDGEWDMAAYEALARAAYEQYAAVSTTYYKTVACLQ